MKGEFVLDASFALRWCFEDEATTGTDSLLTDLQNQEAVAVVPAIFPYELLNGLGKGVTRTRLQADRAFRLWHEITALPIQIAPAVANAELLHLAIDHDLAVYDASYLSIALARTLPVATGDLKLAKAASACGLEVYEP